tara:strand:- start:6 stop:197 length:192 start_codon:yes stop_codon:yes gene_type:complete
MKNIGNEEFHIRYWDLDTMSNIKIKAYPFNIYYERNFDKNDTRIQFGIGIFNYRIGICLDYIN